MTPVFYYMYAGGVLNPKFGLQGCICMCMYVHEPVPNRFVEIMAHGHRKLRLRGFHRGHDHGIGPLGQFATEVTKTQAINRTLMYTNLWLWLGLGRNQMGSHSISYGFPTGSSQWDSSHDFLTPLRRLFSIVAYF